MKLKECCTFLTDGDWIESKDQSESGIRLIQTGNIGNGIFLEKETRAKYISEETFEAFGCTEIYPGDILVSRLPDPVGRACIVPERKERMITAVDCSILRVNDNVVNKRYLLHYLKSQKYFNQIAGKLAGTTRTRISRKNLEQIIIDIPEKGQQVNVANVLDSIESLLRLRQEQLELYDTLVKSRFMEMFGDPESNPYGWKQMKLNDLCSSIVRGPFGSSLKKSFFVEPNETTYKVYEQKHAIQKSATIGTYYVTAEKYKELKRFECVPGDILMSCSGTMGELYQLPEGCEKGIINQALCKFTLNEKILPVVFLIYMKQIIRKLETKGSGIQNIAAVSYIKEMTINLPPIELQNQFAAFVYQVDKLKSAAQKALGETRLLFDSLMQQYFG